MPTRSYGTAQPPGLPAAVACVVLVLALAAGLASTLYAAATGRLELFAGPVDRSAFLEGRTTQGVADALAQAPAPRRAADAARAANWLLLGDLGPQVRQGCPDWLFLTEELTVHEAGQAHLEQRAEVVRQLHGALQDKGIHLFVLVVPDKSRIEGAHLCGLWRPPALEGRIQAWAALLHAGEVPVLDLGASMAGLQETQAGQAFLRTDTHWSEDGAERAAQAVARALRRQWTDWKPEPLQDYDIVREGAAVRPGDLVRLAGIDGLPERWQPASETVRAARFDPRSTDAEEDLFGDAQLPRVALMGTSFSRTSGFAGYLAAELRTPVANFGRDGGNFSGGPAAYFQDAAWHETPPQLLLWEIPERALDRPIQAEERAEWRQLPGAAH